MLSLFEPGTSTVPWLGDLQRNLMRHFSL